MTPLGHFDALHRQCQRPPARTLQRWLRFNLVGVIGLAVQLGALAVFSRALSLGDLWASALAVEVSLLHNFVWHERFTWADPSRAGSFKPALARLIRFNLTNGAISVAGSLVVVWYLRSSASLPLLAANLAAIGCTGLLNFVVCHRLVFRASAPTLTR